MITYCTSYYWLIRLRYFASTPFHRHLEHTLAVGAVVAVHLKLCCSLCCSPEYLQNAFFVLICKSRRRISCNMPYVIDSPRSIELERSPWFRARLAQYWIIRPDCQMEHPPPWSIRPTSTGPLSDLRYMFRQTKEWRQAAEPAYSPYQLQYMYGNGPVILNIIVMWYSPAIGTK